MVRADAWSVLNRYLWAGMNPGRLAMYDDSGNMLWRFEYAGGRLRVAMKLRRD